MVVSVVGLISKDRVFSENENRSLAQKPELSRETLVSGEWFRQMGDYLADQFPGRDLWMSVNLRMNRMLGSKEFGGVYLCEDNYLMQVPAEPNTAATERNLKAMEQFAKVYPELNMVAAVVPNAVTVHAELLPDNAPVRDQREDLAWINQSLQRVTFADVTDKLLEHNTEELFFRTDHHWTSLGAAYAYEEIAPALNLPTPPLSSYTRYTVSETFEGTLASKSGCHGVLDTVEIFVPKTNIEYFVKYPDNGVEICSMYNREALEGKDHYTVFFGGNYSKLEITTTADTGRNLLVFKDSYANSFLQFLYPYYEQIIVVDPRYYYDNLQTVITEGSITEVLFLYNLDTFLSDTSLADVLETA